jgi:hypothetical protein
MKKLNNSLLQIANEIYKHNSNHLLAGIFMRLIHNYYEAYDVLQEAGKSDSDDEILVKCEEIVNLFDCDDMKDYLDKIMTPFTSIEKFEESDAQSDAIFLATFSREEYEVVSKFEKTSIKDLDAIHNIFSNIFKPLFSQIKTMRSTKSQIQMLQAEHNSVDRPLYDELIDTYNRYFDEAGMFYFTMMDNIDSSYMFCYEVQLLDIQRSEGLYSELDRLGLDADKVLNIKLGLELQDITFQLKQIEFDDDPTYTGEDLIADFLIIWKKHLEQFPKPLTA